MEIDPCALSSSFFFSNGCAAGATLLAGGCMVVVNFPSSSSSFGRQQLPSYKNPMAAPSVAAGAVWCNIK